MLTQIEMLRILADESHGVDRHCLCGHVLLDPWQLSCEHCQQPAVELPALLRRQCDPSGGLDLRDVA